MNNTLKIILIVSSVLLVAVGLLIGGIVIGRTVFAPSIFARNFGPGMMWGGDYEGSFGPGMMWNEDYQGEFDRVHGPGMMWGGDYKGSFGPGMMWDENYQSEGCPIESYGYGHGPGMMWQEGFDDEDCPMHGSGFGPGMMWDQDFQGGYGHGPGMMWGFTNTDEDLPILSLEQADEALDEFLQSYEDENLTVKEIMIFSNHAYAEIVEEDTGIGAFEVLIDPVSLDVYPEHGPNMMWNLKYGMHGSMHGSFRSDEEMTVSPEEAVSLAQEYLDANNSGLQVDDHADTFYGYYTLHTLKDGEVVGMLSVNGYTGDVFPHTWHGDFVEMSEDAH